MNEEGYFLGLDIINEVLDEKCDACSYKGQKCRGCRIEYLRRVLNDKELSVPSG